MELTGKLWSYLRKYWWIFFWGLALSLVFVNSWNGIEKCLQSNIDFDICSAFGKSVWEWLDLLIVPAALVGFGILGDQYFKQRDKRQEELSKEQLERQKWQEKIIAEDREKQESIKDYFSEMTKLILNDNWPTEVRADGNIIPHSPKIVAIARARTMSIFRELDTDRKSSVVKFLSESNCLRVVALAFSDLSGVNLESTNLSGSNFNQVNLKGSILNNAYFRESTLIRANLSGSKLIGAKLCEANLTKANLNGSNLSEADLSGANLSGADLRFSDLSLSNLENIVWDEKTQWPHEDEIAKARNMPKGRVNQRGSFLALPPGSPT